MKILKSFINIVKRAYIKAVAKKSCENYCKYLRMCGFDIGGNFLHTDSFNLDHSRPSLVKIGSNCYFNKNFTLLTHDWVTKVFIQSNREFLNSSGRVTIGNNVSFGQNVMVLKGVTIGDNCFIEAGSIVTKDIPSNSIAVGAPCRVVMGLEDYYQLRIVRSEKEALDYAKSIHERYHRKPIPSDFWEEFVWFVSGDEVNNYPVIPIKQQLGPAYNNYIKNHVAKYHCFNDFLEAAGIC